MTWRLLVNVIDATRRQKAVSWADSKTDRQGRLAEISSDTVIDQVPDICYATPRE